MAVFAFASAAGAAPCGPFEDVDAASTFCESVDWIRNRGVTVGCAAGAYCPSDAVSRVAMAAFLNRLGASFADNVVVREQALGAMQAASGTQVCDTPDAFVGTSARVARLDAVFGWVGGGTGDFEIVPLASLDGGATWTPMLATPVAVSAVPLRWRSARLNGDIDIAPGASVRFALGLTPLSGASPVPLAGARCVLRTVLAARGEAGPSFAKVVPPSGGTIEVPGRGAFVFAPGTFPTSRTVDVQVTGDPQTQRLFEETGALFLAGPRTSWEFRVTTGPTPPTQPVHAKLQAPPELMALLATHDVEVFGQFILDTANAGYDQFEPIPATVNAQGVIDVDLPVDLFTDERSASGPYEAILLVAATPRFVPPPDLRVAAQQWRSPIRPAVSSAAGGYAGSLKACTGGLLAPPLDGSLAVTDTFGGKHKGVDYDTADDGTVVRAAAAGTVHYVATAEQFSEKKKNRFGSPGRGWGWFVVIKHAIGQTLYAHLKEGSIVVEQGAQVNAGDPIATADSSGGVTGSHLHFEHAVKGNAYAKTSEKIDPDPCVRPWFQKIDPAGTYLFVDTALDTPRAPSELNLVAAGAEEGDFLSVEGVGAFSAGSSFTDTITSQIAVFVDAGGNRVSPAGQSTVPLIQTLPSCAAVQFPTDVAEDFSVPNFSVFLAKIPASATRMQVSTNDCFFVDNTDPNNDYGIAIRLWRPPQSARD